MSKASGGDRILVELFKILKDDAVEVLYLICQQLWKTQEWSQTGKSQFSFQSQRRALPKNVGRELCGIITQVLSFHMLAMSC